MKYYLYGVAYGTIVFAVYTQFSPKMGGVWIRNGKFTPRGLLNLMIYPFTNKEIWRPRVWDINWIIVSGLFGSLFHYLGLQTQEQSGYKK